MTFWSELSFILQSSLQNSHHKCLSMNNQKDKRTESYNASSTRTAAYLVVIDTIWLGMLVHEKLRIAHMESELLKHDLPKKKNGTPRFAHKSANFILFQISHSKKFKNKKWKVSDCKFSIRVVGVSQHWSYLNFFRLIKIICS